LPVGALNLYGNCSACHMGRWEKKNVYKGEKPTKFTSTTAYTHFDLLPSINFYKTQQITLG